MENNRGQVTIFVIVAILIIAIVVVAFFMLSESSVEDIPATFSPAYTQFLKCIEDEAYLGADLLGTGGGYIYVDEIDFEPGSAYMPFSSHFDFYGNAVPYWYYVSGNNLEREQVPTRSDMEQELERMLVERIRVCSFEVYEEEGFSIDAQYEEASADVQIEDTQILVDISMPLTLEKDGESVFIRDHSRTIQTHLGELHSLALEVYDYEQQTLFLENYGIDVLRTYAPVDGVEFSCKPEVWIGLNVSETVKSALEANIQSIRVKGDYYELQHDEDIYFEVDLGSDLDSHQRVNFLYSRNWPYGFEAGPSEGDLLIANPVGNQEGLGALGFCYVPYHFVYDLKYPVLVQVMADDGAGMGEVFQFPIAIVLRGNQPRAPLPGSAAISLENDNICQTRNQEVAVRVVDTDLNPVEADVSFSCLGASCTIGSTVQGRLIEYFPQCVNGVVVAKAEGFAPAKYTLSTNREDFVNIIMQKTYEKDIEVFIDGRPIDQQAIITFSGESGSKTISYPEQRTIDLSQDYYSIRVQVFGDSALTIPETTTQQCYEVPKGTIGGYLGVTDEECVDVVYPETELSQVVVAGGSLEYFVLEEELINSNSIEINTQGAPTPRTLDDLHVNYAIADEGILEVNFA